MNAAVSTEVRPEVSISTWNIDPVHSTAQFKVKHMMISNVTGEFTSINGILDLDENDITKSKIRASIDAATISTREPQRDAHLKSADFFHVEKHSALTFNSTSITRSTDGELKVSGDLTICGVTRNIVFDVDGPSTAQKDPWGNTRIGLSATTRISRKDFGLTWNAALETGGLLVGDAVTINLDVQLIKER
jgi:polyisoprenoid-binding protein YceI